MEYASHHLIILEMTSALFFANGLKTLVNQCALNKIVKRIFTINFIRTTLRQNKLNRRKGRGVPITQSLPNSGEYDVVIESLKITA